MTPPMLLIDADILVYRTAHSGSKSDDILMCVENLENILDTIFIRFSGYDKRLFLTGHGNFREKVAKIKKYKGTRDVNKRPKYYDAIREYMVNFHEAEVVNKMEGDDALGISQNENSVIC